MTVQQLSIPPSAHRADEAFELLRCWSIDTRLVCSLLPGAYDDPGYWGMLMADVVQHLANALAQTKGADRGEVVRRIFEVFQREIASPSDAHPGQFVGVPPQGGPAQAAE